MNVTFIIGNGFDLNLGLETSYKDFYTWLEGIPSDNILQQYIQNNYEYWSDLEEGIGQITEEISPENFAAFMEHKEDLEMLLSAYLLEQQNSFSFPRTAEFAEEFIEHIVNFQEKILEGRNSNFRDALTNTSENHFSFITLNYTTVLDEIIAFVNDYLNKQQRPSPFSPTVYHMHGHIDNIYLGVANSSQIANAYLRDRGKYLIKPFLIERFNNEVYNKIKTLIQTSDYICIYGSSFGATDQTWWSLIIRWLEKDKRRRLILYIHEDFPVTCSVQRRARFWDGHSDFFVKRSNEFVEQNVLEQIVIVPKNSIFDFDNLQCEEPKGKEPV